VHFDKRKTVCSLKAFCQFNRKEKGCQPAFLKVTSIAAPSVAMLVI
jgi:hypothetical protein